jgi:sec-independent protein translocase protein TatB
MFGMGMGELLLIMVVALLVVGPDKLPQAAKAIGKGIRDFRRHSHDLQSTLEQDEKLGEAVRELRSALRDDPLRFATRPTPRPAGTTPPGTASASTDAAAGDASASAAAAAAAAPEGEAAMGPPSIVPAAGTVAKQSPVARAGAAPADARPDPRPSPPRSKVDDPPHG